MRVVKCVTFSPVGQALAATPLNKRREAENEGQPVQFVQEAGQMRPLPPLQTVARLVLRAVAGNTKDIYEGGVTMRKCRDCSSLLSDKRLLLCPDAVLQSEKDVKQKNAKDLTGSIICQADKKQPTDQSSRTCRPRRARSICINA